MNWVVIILAIVFLTLIYILYRYFYITYTTLTPIADLKNSNSLITTIDKSANSSYAYGIWVYVNNVNSQSNIIFGRLNSSGDINNIGSRGGYMTPPAVSTLAAGATASPVQTVLLNNGNEYSIALYLDSTKPTLYCDLPGNGASTSTASYTDIITQNFPFQKWCHIIVSVDGQYVDYYLNGKLIKSVQKDSSFSPDDITKQSNSNVFIGNSGGIVPNGYRQYLHSASSQPFDAYVANFQRWTAAIDPQTAWTTYLGGNGQSSTMSNYNIQFALLKDNVQQYSSTVF